MGPIKQEMGGKGIFEQKATKITKQGRGKGMADQIGDLGGGYGGFVSRTCQESWLFIWSRFCRNPRMSLRSLMLAGWMLGMGLLATARADIYADVTVAGGVSGTFRITLEPTKAPVAVANFIGLATGQNGWIDPVTGRLRRDPFYNGLTFHRVIANFVSQTGSRTGDGTDGPGYTFANEIDGTLTHATPYTVAMANSGGAFSNGSQFYITTPTSAAFLDGNYTIFGRVTSGTAVCDALNAVATTGSGGTPSDKPLTDVTISSITFGGSSLAGFNLQPSGLPRVISAKTALKINGASYALSYDHQPYSAYFASNSADLVTWSRFINSSYFHTSAPAAGDLDVTSLASGARQFFQMPRVDYSLARNTRVPSSIANKTLSFPGIFGMEQMHMTFNSAGSGGTYSFNYPGDSTLTGNITAVNYIPGNSPYAPFLYVMWDSVTYFDGNLEIAFDRLKYGTTTTCLLYTSPSPRD